MNGEQAWKVGELARASGLTVRTLHHYDHIGLLRPSARTSAGHRLYSPADVARLYRVTLLRRLGFPLEQIGSVLDDPEWQLEPAVRRHLAQARERAASYGRLSGQLESMAAALSGDALPTGDQLFATLEEMTMTDTVIRGTTGLLVYDDLAAAHDYLVRVYGLEPGRVERDDGGHPVYAEVRAGDRTIMLHHVGPGYQSPRSLGAVSGMTAISVDSADEHYASAVSAGADIIAAPADRSYGVREYTARDLEGHWWCFSSPLI